MSLKRLVRRFLPVVMVALAPLAVSAQEKKLESFEEKIPGFPVSFKMVAVPGGTVEVKTSREAEPVKVEVKPFYICEHETRWEEFDIFYRGFDIPDQKLREETINAKITRPSAPYSSPTHNFGHNGFPALSMSYKSAAKYCEWLSEKTKKKYRLPTEAEWVHACQAGEGFKQLPPEELAKFAWFVDNSQSDDFVDGKTQPVKKKQPNAWGLYDMLGNAMEWCVGLDGTPVAKGGSYRHGAKVLNSQTRNVQTKEWNDTDPNDPKSTWWLSDGKHVSFRVVCEP
jgi:formylglycine-generating enzyme required for sulfatase activity